MATLFSDLYKYIRSLLGDYDSDRYVYSNDVLNDHISLVVISLNDDDIVETEIGGVKQFTDDLTSQEKAEVFLGAILNIIASQSDTFAYRTPTLSVTRRGGINSLRARTEDLLNKIKGGMISISSDDDITALVKGTERFIDDLTNAGL